MHLVILKGQQLPVDLVEPCWTSLSFSACHWKTPASLAKSSELLFTCRIATSRESSDLVAETPRSGFSGVVNNKLWWFFFWCSYIKYIQICFCSRTITSNIFKQSSKFTFTWVDAWQCSCIWSLKLFLVITVCTWTCCASVFSFSKVTVPKVCGSERAPEWLWHGAIHGPALEFPNFSICLLHLVAI